MLTCPEYILAHLAEGALGLRTTNTLFPDESLGESTPSVRFRARVPLFIGSPWPCPEPGGKGARHERAYPSVPGPSDLFASFPRLTRHSYCPSCH